MTTLQSISLPSFKTSLALRASRRHGLQAAELSAADEVKLYINVCHTTLGMKLLPAPSPRKKSTTYSIHEDGYSTAAWPIFLPEGQLFPGPASQPHR